MPGFDGTGPMGMGPRTGGGRGFCPPVAGYAPYGGYSYSAYPYGGYPYSGYPFGGQPYGFYPYGGYPFAFGVGRGGFPRGGGRGRAFGGGRGRSRWWW